MFINLEAVVQRCSVKEVFLEISQNSQENTSGRVSFLIKLRSKACNFIKKEALAEVFSCEFCEISKNTFLRKTALVAAFVNFNFVQRLSVSYSPSCRLVTGFFCSLSNYPTGIYLFKVDNGNTGIMYEICSLLTTKTMNDAFDWVL